jgi:plastocyanin
MKRVLAVALTGILTATGCAVGQPSVNPAQTQFTELPPAPTDVMDNGTLIRITGTGALPHSLIAAVGDTITWRNDSGKIITVRLIDGSEPSGDIGPGGTYTHVFGTSGSFAYRVGRSNDPAGIVEVLPPASSESTPVATS